MDHVRVLQLTAVAAELWLHLIKLEFIQAFCRCWFGTWRWRSLAFWHVQSVLTVRLRITMTGEPVSLKSLGLGNCLQKLLSQKKAEKNCESSELKIWTALQWIPLKLLKKPVRGSWICRMEVCTDLEPDFAKISSLFWRLQKKGTMHSESVVDLNSKEIHTFSKRKLKFLIGLTRE